MISRPPTFTSKGAAGEAVFILHCPKGPPAVRENFGFDRPELNRIAGQRLAQGLAGASPADLSEIEISPAGLGLHRPQLDADLYVPAILQGVFGSKRWMPLN